MKKTEKKKSDKKKTAAGKNKKLPSKDLQRDFNKRMKVLVRDIRKETEVTIKNVLKEAKRKIHEGSEFVMNDVLNSIVSTVENAEEAVLGKKEQKDSKKAEAAETKSEENAPEPVATAPESTAVPTAVAQPAVKTSAKTPATKKSTPSRASKPTPVPVVAPIAEESLNQE